MGRVHKKKIAEYAEASEGDAKSNSNSAASRDSVKSGVAALTEDSIGSSEDQNQANSCLVDESSHDNYDENTSNCGAVHKSKKVQDSDDVVSDDEEPLNGDLSKKARKANSSIKNTKKEENDVAESSGKRKSASKRKVTEKSKKHDSGTDDNVSDDEPLIGVSASKKAKLPASKGKNRKGNKTDVAKKSTAVKDDQNEEYEVKEVVGSKVEDGVTFYLIRWKGYTKHDDTWEPEDTLSCPELIEKYKKKQPDLKKKLTVKKVRSSKPVDPDKEWEVEKIIDYAESKNGKVFRVRWKGFKSNYDTWEPEANLSCDEIINKFMDRMKSQENVSFKVLREEPKKTKRLVNETAPITNYHNAIGRKSKRNVTKQRIYYGDDDE